MKKIVRLSENELTSLIKTIVEQIQPNVSDSTYVYNRFKTKDPDEVLNHYLRFDRKLIPIYKEIERTLNDKFTKEDFEKEIKYSGNIKPLSNSLSPNAIKMFNKMLKTYGLQNKVSIDKDSFRTHEKQKDTFIKMARKHGGTISGGLRQAALPGFSQHHTGKAFDISPSNLVTDKMLSSFNFKRPYKVDTGFRMPEPWHIIYLGS